MTDMRVEYVTHYGDDLSPVNAARVSMNKQSDWEVVGYNEEVDVDSRTIILVPQHMLSYKDRNLIAYLAKHKHTSCFEHQGATLRLKVPIFIARQIQRHRTFSYNEVSRRYVDSAPEFYWPDKWRKRADNKKQGSSDEVFETEPLVAIREWERGQVVAAPSKLQSLMVAMYNGLVALGVAPEQARMILPQNMMVNWVWTGSLLGWAQMCKARLADDAQRETQEFARKVQDVVAPLYPVSWDNLMRYL